ncbi:hypothetical protein [Ectothiorhodospira sp. BSL-9]|uniref:hypothetical protein n=1 Tax=Ectothiorhodospira sp. BSL-9 TaxID=1442136 RepID=UPI0007B446AE|nr:hypothetical protein [Ectothiorhodospira sp. BSL-9]ANB02039.1 hypothetical protein ECTOBSL9_1309 [Ectothiorhodospira sp. BSL-9]
MALAGNGVFLSAVDDGTADGEQLLDRALALTRELRKRRLRHERATAPLAGAPQRPDIYWDHAPSGRYPIIAFRSVPCDKYVLGFCGPCSYSARAHPAGLTREAQYASLPRQLEWLLERFDDLFVAEASGRLPGYRLRSAPRRPWYMLQLAGESSFFRDAEVPPIQRKMILERLLTFQEERGVNLHLMLECRAEHILNVERSGELRDLAPLLRSLDAVINVGFEAENDFLRNVGFAKDLPRTSFIKAMKVAQVYGLDPGVFVFAGATFLTVAEILEQTTNSLMFLEKLGLFANVMVPNLQAYTLPDLLHEVGLYRLPEPYFLLDLADRLLAFRPVRSRPVTPFDWFLGGLESDPRPRCNLLTNPHRQTTDAVTEAIHACIIDLVRNQDDVAYRARAARLRAAPDHAFHEHDLRRRDARPWCRRLQEQLDVAAGFVENYYGRLRAAGQ